MLVLTRLRGQHVLVGENIVIRVVEIRPGQVKLAFDAPKAVNIVRDEIAGADHPLRARVDELLQRKKAS